MIETEQRRRAVRDQRWAEAAIIAGLAVGPGVGLVWTAARMWAALTSGPGGEDRAAALVVPGIVAVLGLGIACAAAVGAAWAVRRAWAGRR